MRPKGHPVQPNVDEVCDCIRKYLNLYNRKVFLVTEDAEIKRKIMEEFPNKIVLIENDIVFNDYNKKDMLSNSIKKNDLNKIEVAKTYLIKILLLSKCRYLIASKTNGSLMALIMNGGKYEDSYLFEKGYY